MQNMIDQNLAIGTVTHRYFLQEYRRMGKSFACQKPRFDLTVSLVFDTNFCLREISVVSLGFKIASTTMILSSENILTVEHDIV